MATKRQGTLTLAETAAKRALFLEALAQTANVRLSCQAANIGRSTAYRWREKWATFRTGWDEAIEDACDVLEALAWQRARGTQDRPGSDRLLMFLLKAHRRELYGDQARYDITGLGGVIQLTWDDDEDQADDT